MAGCALSAPENDSWGVTSLEAAGVTSWDWPAVLTVLPVSSDSYLGGRGEHEASDRGALGKDFRSWKNISVLLLNIQGGFLTGHKVHDPFITSKIPEKF